MSCTCAKSKARCNPHLTIYLLFKAHITIQLCKLIQRFDQFHIHVHINSALFIHDL